MSNPSTSIKSQIWTNILFSFNDCNTNDISSVSNDLLIYINIILRDYKNKDVQPYAVEALRKDKKKVKVCIIELFRIIDLVCDKKKSFPFSSKLLELLRNYILMQFITLEDELAEHCIENILRILLLCHKNVFCKDLLTALIHLSVEEEKRYKTEKFALLFKGLKDKRLRVLDKLHRQTIRNKSDASFYLTNTELDSGYTTDCNEENPCEDDFFTSDETSLKCLNAIVFGRTAPPFNIKTNIFQDVVEPKKDDEHEPVDENPILTDLTESALSSDTFKYSLLLAETNALNEIVNCDGNSGINSQNDQASGSHQQDSFLPLTVANDDDEDCLAMLKDTKNHLDLDITRKNTSEDNLDIYMLEKQNTSHDAMEFVSISPPNESNFCDKDRKDDTIETIKNVVNKCDQYTPLPLNENQTDLNGLHAEKDLPVGAHEIHKALVEKFDGNDVSLAKETIKKYLELINSERKQCFIANVLTYTKNLNFKKWSRSLNIKNWLNWLKFITPIYYKDHWFLILLDITSRRIIYIDGSTNHEKTTAQKICETMLNLIDKEFQLNNFNFDKRNWKISYEVGHSKDSYVWDSGAFLCAYIEFITRHDDKSSFKIDVINDLKTRIFKELENRELFYK